MGFMGKREIFWGGKLFLVELMTMVNLRNERYDMGLVSFFVDCIEEK